MYKDIYIYIYILILIFVFIFINQYHIYVYIYIFTCLYIYIHILYIYMYCESAHNHQLHLDTWYPNHQAPQDFQQVPGELLLASESFGVQGNQVLWRVGQRPLRAIGWHLWLRQPLLVLWRTTLELGVQKICVAAGWWRTWLKGS